MTSEQENEHGKSANGTIQILAIIWKWRLSLLTAFVAAIILIAAYLLMTTSSTVVKLTLHTGMINPDKEQPLISAKKLKSKLELGNIEFSFRGYCNGKLRKCDVLNQLDIIANEKQQTLKLVLPVNKLKRPAMFMDSLAVTIREYYRPKARYHEQSLKRTVLLRKKELKDILLKIDNKKHILNLEHGQQAEKMKQFSKEINNKQSRITVLKNQINTQKQRIIEINNEIEELSTSNQELIEERKSFIDKVREGKLSYFSLLSNTIQQNFRHISNLRNTVFNLKYQINQEKGDIEQLQNNVDYQQSRIDYLRKDAGKATNMMYTEIEKLKTQKESLKTKMSLLNYQLERVENVGIISGPEVIEGYNFPALFWRGIKLLITVLFVLIVLLLLYEYIIRHHSLIKDYAG